MRNKNIKIIYLAGFLFSISVALVSYINSSFLEKYIDKNYIGIVYSIASILTIIGLLKMPKILERFGNRLTIILSSLLILLSFTTLAFSNIPLLSIVAFIIYFISVSYVISSLDVFIEDFSKNSSTGKLRGFYLTIINLAWIVAQMISGSVINKSSFKGVYLLSAAFIFLVVSIFILFLQDFKDPKYKRISIRKTINSFVQKKHISKIYLSNLILQFFYAWMVIYTPIYLHEYMGFGWDKIGIIFSIMLLPFVILDYPLGRLSDKIGEKKMLKIGFFIIFLSVLIIPLIKEPILWMWAIVLFVTRIGAATIEVMNEIYFFKAVKEEDADEISFYRNASPLSYVIAPLFATPILLLVPSFSYLFFILSAILLIGLYNSLKIKDLK